MSPGRCKQAQLLAVLLAGTTQGCGPPSPARVNVVPSPPLHVTSAPSSAPTEPGAASPGLPDPSELKSRLEDAYAKRSRGELSEADTEFARLAHILSSAYIKPSMSLEQLNGYIVEGRTLAGFNACGSTLFFDRSTGDPNAFADVALGPSPALDARSFVTTTGELYDSGTGAVDIGGRLVALDPDGHRAYALDRTCGVIEWSISEARVLRHLDSAASALTARDICPSCVCDDSLDLGDVAVSHDGRWLVAPWGRWSLVSKAFSPFRIRASHRAAVSPDGRFLAYLQHNPNASSGAVFNVDFLILLDVERGATAIAHEQLPVIINPYPLKFGEDPLRLCLMDFGTEVFGVPSLSVTPALSKTSRSTAPDQPDYCVRPPPSRLPDVEMRLAQHVCAFGCYLLPRRYCEPPIAPI